MAFLLFITEIASTPPIDLSHLNTLPATYQAKVGGVLGGTAGAAIGAGVCILN